MDSRIFHDRQMPCIQTSHSERQVFIYYCREFADAHSKFCLKFSPKCSFVSVSSTSSRYLCSSFTADAPFTVYRPFCDGIVIMVPTLSHRHILRSRLLVNIWCCTLFMPFNGANTRISGMHMLQNLRQMLKNLCKAPRAPRKKSPTISRLIGSPRNGEVGSCYAVHNTSDLSS